MRLRVQHKFLVFKDWLSAMFDGPQALALLPAMVLGGFWLGGEPLLMTMALGFPLCIALTSYSGVITAAETFSAPEPHAPEDREGFIVALDISLRKARKNGRSVACIVVEIGGQNPRASTLKLQRKTLHILRHIEKVTRDHDCICRLAENQIGLVVSPRHRITDKAGLNMAQRIQRSLARENVSEGGKDGCTVTIGSAVGDPLVDQSGQELLNCALLAVKEARRDRSYAVRAFTPGISERQIDAAINETRAVQALENGEIIPWFQPQVCNETGQISGFEALARWLHPQRGIVSPAEFLPLLDAARQLEKLGEVVLHHSCDALKAWDKAGYSIPRVGVNFTDHELSNPGLIDKIAWQLDRHELLPKRICVEILETVVATASDDTLANNISRLAELGFGIDLDDFGTAHASMTSIQRFSVQRLKIDRSFVAHVDKDPEQRRMVSAIILMAEQLGLDTLAEGVESAGEHTLMAQLGCGHVQGFGIGRPMPVSDTFDWIDRHLTKFQILPEIGRKNGRNRQ